MLATDQIQMPQASERGVARWFADRALYEMARFWTCYWWALRAHMAATHGIPRSSLEEPPEEWLRALLGPDDRPR